MADEVQGADSNPPSAINNPYIHVPDGRTHRGQQMQLGRGGEFNGVWELTIDKLPPSGFASILFYTSDSDTNYIKWSTTPLWASPPNPSTVADTNELRFSLEGEYQFQAENKPQKQYFLVPITYDIGAGKISSAPNADQYRQLGANNFGILLIIRLALIAATGPDGNH